MTTRSNIGYVRDRGYFSYYIISVIAPVRYLIALRLSVVLIVLRLSVDLTTFVMISDTSTVCCASRNGYLRG